MVKDWVYPIDENSKAWGYTYGGRTVPAHDVLMGHVTHFDNQTILSGDSHHWVMRKNLKEFGAGDRIWIRLTGSGGKIIAMGEVLSDLIPGPTPGSNEYWFDVTFDNGTTGALAADPFTLKKHAQSTRTLEPGEREALESHLSGYSDLLDDPHTGKERAYRQVTLRQHQSAFREGLKRAYRHRCAISGATAEEALQAAHITNYDGPSTSTTPNGLLLRSDLHLLFDAHLIWIDDHYYVHITDTLMGEQQDEESTYSMYEGVQLDLPDSAADFPDLDALRMHRQKVARKKLVRKSLVEPGRIVVLMPNARNGRCPECGKRDSLRRMLVGMHPGPRIDDPSVIYAGCTVTDGVPWPTFCCAECTTEFDSSGGRIEDW